MPIEIERKFLVTGSNWKTPNPERICQGYLNRHLQSTVRVRIIGKKAFLTVKGSTKGATRAEFEYEIPLHDAEELLALCEGPLIEKVRHKINYAGRIWEIDEFFGDNQGLVVAEVELDDENQAIEIPSWITTEVTTDPRYYNSNLALKPYSQWAPATERKVVSCALPM